MHVQTGHLNEKLSEWNKTKPDNIEKERKIKANDIVTRKKSSQLRIFLQQLPKFMTKYL